MKKCANFCCSGLGDGMISMILSHNLFLNGFETVTFHNGDFFQLQKWFEHLPIEKFPKIEHIPDLIREYDQIFVSYDSVDPFIQALIKEAKEKYPNKIKVLNPSFSKNNGNQPFYRDALFKNDISMVENMENFCTLIGLEKVTKENGMKCPYDLVSRKNSKQVVIQPTSAKKGRSWTREKFFKLADKLKAADFNPCFVVSSKEALSWQDVLDRGFTLKAFGSLDEVAKFVYESGFMIGNDSGMGHLASCLKLPTLCISRSKRTTDLWRPAWKEGIVIYPFSLIPNISGFRIRDKYWKFFITSDMAFKSFLKLVKKDLAAT